jgi:hypothetical protein
MILVCALSVNCTINYLTAQVIIFRIYIYIYKEYILFFFNIYERRIT